LRGKLSKFQPSDALKLQSYEKVPIYRCARDLLRDAHVLTARMPKQFKFTLGSSINGYATDLAHAIFVAYEENEDQNKKLRLIKDIGTFTQKLLASYRICLDLNLIPRGNDKQLGYTQQVERIIHVIAQHKGWSARLAETIKQ